MKALLISAFMLLTIICKGQGGFLGLERADIKKAMIGSNHPFLESGKTKDGNPYDAYIGVKDSITVCFYFKKNACVDIKEIYNKVMLTTTIQFLNSRYIKIDGLHWLDKDGKFNIFMKILDDSDSFTVDYGKI